MPGSSRVPRPVLATLGGAFPLNQGGMAGLLPSVTSAAAPPAPVPSPLPAHWCRGLGLTLYVDKDSPATRVCDGIGITLVET